MKLLPVPLNNTPDAFITSATCGRSMHIASLLWSKVDDAAGFQIVAIAAITTVKIRLIKHDSTPPLAIAIRTGHLQHIGFTLTEPAQVQVERRLHSQSAIALHYQATFRATGAFNFRKSNAVYISTLPLERSQPDSVASPSQWRTGIKLR